MRGSAAAGVMACASLVAACAASRPQGVVPAAVPASPAAPAGAGIDAAVDASLVRQGYHVVRTGDRVRYCRTQTPTGTAFASTVCLSHEQVEQQRRSLQQSQDDLSLTRAITCSAKICAGN